MRREWLEKDYYQTLGVQSDANSKDIKKAYRKLAQEFHPDTNAGDEKAEARFKDISEAYATLSDDEDRKQYDAARDAVRQGTFTGGPGGGANQYVRIDDLGETSSGSAATPVRSPNPAATVKRNSPSPSTRPSQASQRRSTPTAGE